MNFKREIQDSATYIKNHKNEELVIRELGEMYSWSPEYYSYLFSIYYNVNVRTYIDMIRRDDAQIENVNRKVASGKVEVNYVDLPSFVIEGKEVDYSGEEINPLGAMLRTMPYTGEQESGAENPWMALWWYDDDYNLYYVNGRKTEHNADDTVTGRHITVPSSSYAVFSVRGQAEPENMEEDMKDILYYAMEEWMKENEVKVDPVGYSFELYQGGRGYYYLPLLEEERREPMEKIYGVDTWTKYIDEHLTMKLTTAALANKFHYSATHFKRIFRQYYDISVSDYIRKRRLQVVAEKMREGEDYMELAPHYGFSSYTGFSRAFQKEFNVTPRAYSNGIFRVVDLPEFYKEYKNKLFISIVDIKEIKMIGQSILTGKGEDIDIPAQVLYWMNRDFPCLENTRYAHNCQQRDDKIAIWYQEPEYINIKYVLGPVVKSFEEDIPKEMIPITIEGGKYAIFETDRLSDRKDVASTIRMYTRCVFYGWIKEYREKVDLDRFTFERYIDDKIYLYVPLK